MRYISKFMAGALFFASTMSSCSNDTPDPAPDNNIAMRELTVTVAPMSRTTIEYENSDFSHLVWNDGDEVAYVTDIYGDTFRKATVSHNNFKALVPENAGSNDKLIIVYPAGDLEGKTKDQMTLTLVNPDVIDVDGKFDGRRLPLTSVMPVPSSSSVTADFEVMGSVIRLNPIPNTHGEEQLASITLSADQDLKGAYTRSYYGWYFSGSGKSVTMGIKSEDKSLGSLNSGKRYIYIVVPRDSFTGVDLTLTTDAGVYSFTGGEMNLNQDGKTLYRLDLPLGEPDPVSEPMFKKITSMDDVTIGDQDKYLIVCEDKSVIYCNYDSSNYYEGESVSIGSDGIVPDDKTNMRQFSIFEHPVAGCGKYYLKLDNKIGKGNYLSVMSNFSSTPGKLYHLSATDNQRSSWDMNFDENGNLILKGHPMTQDIAGDVFLGFYSSDMNSNYFSTYGPDVDKSKILSVQLYKLSK